MWRSWSLKQDIKDLVGQLIGFKGDFNNGGSKLYIKQPKPLRFDYLIYHIDKEDIDKTCASHKTLCIKARRKE